MIAALFVAKGGPYTVSKGAERQRAKRAIENGPMVPEYDPREYVPPGKGGSE